MSRIKSQFERLSTQGQKALIPFITVGDPHPDWTVDIMHALVDGGASVIELGVPFSDPMADGPVIQEASERAIEKGVSLSSVLSTVSEFRKSDSQTPLVLMGYMNPIVRYGVERLAEDCATAGVDGILLVDCPPEEAANLTAALGQKGVDSIRLIAPTTVPERMKLICEAAEGFVYYVSFKGITGANRLDADSLKEPISAIRQLTNLPVATGFGISDAESAVAVAKHADAVVIGSALVKRLSDAVDAAQAAEIARTFVASVRESLDNSAQSQ